MSVSIQGETSRSSDLRLGDRVSRLTSAPSEAWTWGIVASLTLVWLLCAFWIYRSLVLSDIRSAPFGLLLIISVVIGLVTVAANYEIRLVRRKQAQAAALSAFTRSLVAEGELDRIVDSVLDHISETFQRPVAVFLPDNGRLSARSRGLDGVPDELEAAAWAYESGEETGCGSAHFAGARMHYWPLKTAQGVGGVIGVQAKDTPLRPDQQELLITFLNQAALAITRANLSEKARRTELLQETDKFQKALLNSVSHDLRSPLVSVIGGLNSVLHDAALLDPGTQRTLLEMARDEAVRLNRLVQNLLDMTRLEGGAILVKSERCDVHDVVGTALEQLGEAAHNRPISITIAPGLPLVPMDQALIVQVLVNLLDNAIKYSPANSPIEIDSQRAGDQLEFRIADRGKGIPEHELERVFDKFFRGRTAETSRGVGLGLSICKGFVAAHNGRIWAKRRPQGGTEIAFCLPMGPKG